MSQSNDKKNILNWVDPKDKSGEFKRQASVFRNWIKNEPGAEFPPEKDRYHLYVSYACPWAHRALIVRKLKGLEDIIPYTSVHYQMLEKGWRFAEPGEDVPGDNVTPDPLHDGYTHLRDIYFEQNPDYEGRFTVPTLYDKKQKRIVNNESAEIIRMMYREFDDLLPEKFKRVDLLPDDLKEKIEETNEWTYNEINNGVYKSGFATSQQAYSTNVHTLFRALSRANSHLASTAISQGPYYFGTSLTEADVRLFTTIVRFDAVYVQHFKCNLCDVRSGLPSLHRWLRYLYWDPDGRHGDAFSATTQFEHIKRHYTMSHRQINPFGIVPEGPEVDILGWEEAVPVVQDALTRTV